MIPSIVEVAQPQSRAENTCSARSDTCVGWGFTYTGGSVPLPSVVSRKRPGLRETHALHATHFRAMPINQPKGFHGPTFSGAIHQANLKDYFNESWALGRQKSRLDPRWRVCRFSQAEPGSDFRPQEHEMAKQKRSTFERLTNGAMNRQQRRDLARRLAGNDPGLAIVHSNAGGIDAVGNESHFAAVPPDRDANPVRCWTADLKRMAA
jgi:hypothetical protein